jgi:putative acyl-CoA dehydrogenase
VPTIIEMVNHTRLDCVIGGAAIMRHAVAQATHHARHRATFGRRLVEHPLMQNVLADLCVESEAATASMMRLARAYDAGDEREKLFARLATAVVKYWVCKRTPVHAAEALECLGGNGYVEESGLPRLYREAPLNGIWEGSGNVICLDVLRAMSHGPEVVEAFLAELAPARAAEPRLDTFVARIERDLRERDGLEARARSIVERLAIALAGAILVRHGEPAVAEAYVTSRLAGEHGIAFGTLPRGTAFKTIVERATPVAG